MTSDWQTCAGMGKEAEVVTEGGPGTCWLLSHHLGSQCLASTPCLHSLLLLPGAQGLLH